jgi:hypothetical protein
MEYRIELPTPLPSLRVLSTLLRDEDAAAIDDFDQATSSWRVNTCLVPDEVLGVLARAGCKVLPAQITLLPSICCGGCSG